MTRLALVNAIYFKGNWMNRFDVANTKEMAFKVNPVIRFARCLPELSTLRNQIFTAFLLLLFLLSQDETKTVQMMYQMKKLPYNYIPDHGLQILELPYVDEELSMFILLPEESADGSDPLLKVSSHKLLLQLST